MKHLQSANSNLSTKFILRGGQPSAQPEPEAPQDNGGRRTYKLITDA